MRCFVCLVACVVLGGLGGLGGGRGVDASCGVIERDGRGQYWPFSEELFLTKLGDNMVLAANDSMGLPAKLWGECALPNESLLFHGFGGDNVSVTADDRGHFEVFLSAAASTKGVDVGITGVANVTNKFHSALRNVVFGDVWLCGGQSNMDFLVLENFAAENTTNALGYSPDIRVMPDVVHKGWTQVLHYYDISHFSAVCYFTAVFSKLSNPYYRDRPIGLIHHSIGGTTIETWMPAEALEKCGLPGNVTTRSCGQNNTVNFGGAAQFRNMSVNTILWYQGESNVDCNAAHPVYSCEFRELISSWREYFGGDVDAHLPFVFVQLAAYGSTDRAPQQRSADPLPLLRWAQTDVLSMSNVGMAVAIDAGDSGKAYTPPSPHHGGIHPRNKTVVGMRAALALQAITNKDSPNLGPQLEGASVSGDGKVVVQFSVGDRTVGLFDTEDCGDESVEGVVSESAGFPVEHRRQGRGVGAAPCLFGPAMDDSAILQCCSDHCAAHGTLEEAKQACVSDPNCRGVTLSTQFHGGYQLRAGEGTVPSALGETSWVLENAGDCHAKPTAECCKSASATPFEIGLSNGTFVLASWTVKSAGAVELTAQDEHGSPVELSAADVGAVRYAWQGFPLCLVQDNEGMPAPPFWLNITQNPGRHARSSTAFRGDPLWLHPLAATP